MKISPSEIKQKTFTKKSFGGGYDREEVSAFLVYLAQEWEKISDENKESKIKIDFLEKEISKLKEVETSLFRTLKTAEDTSANMVEQARKNAELKVRDAQIKADVVLTEARNQAKVIVQKAQLKAKNIFSETVDELKIKEREYHLLENHKDSLAASIRGFINETLEKVDKLGDNDAKEYFAQKIQEARDMVEEKQDFINQNGNNISVEESSYVPTGDNNANGESNSFFDNLDG